MGHPSVERASLTSPSSSLGVEPTSTASTLPPSSKTSAALPSTPASAGSAGPASRACSMTVLPQASPCPARKTTERNARRRFIRRSLHLRLHTRDGLPLLLVAETILDGGHAIRCAAPVLQRLRRQTAIEPRDRLAAGGERTHGETVGHALGGVHAV